MDEGKVREIVEKIGRQFSTFGGGKEVPGNPISAALKDHPMQFTAGVSVEGVVRFVLEEAEK